MPLLHFTIRTTTVVLLFTIIERGNQNRQGGPISITKLVPGEPIWLLFWFQGGPNLGGVGKFGMTDTMRISLTHVRTCTPSHTTHAADPTQLTSWETRSCASTLVHCWMPTMETKHYTISHYACMLLYDAGTSNTGHSGGQYTQGSTELVIGWNTPK